MQTQVEINVLQGERPMAVDNKSLGRFILDGLPPAPRGVPQIEVTFDINADGILNVSAKDKATGREQAMQIIPSSGLAENEIDRMVKDAELHAAEDARRREEVETVNLADSAVYSADKFIQDNSERLSDDQKQKLRAEIDAVKGAAGTEVVRSAVTRLQQVMQEIGAAMYQQQAPPAEGDGAGPQPGVDEAPSDEDVVEGEYSED
jgi:molecular chaperone DnaK